MRASLTLALALLALAACSRARPQIAAAPPPPPTMTPTEAIASAAAADWRPVDPENLLVIDLRDGRRVVIELAPAFAPVHVANIRAFARAGWWDKAAVYRVQDNYVAQWGNGDAENPLPAGVVKTPPAEYERAIGGTRPTPLLFPDAYAPATGYLEGWPIAYEPVSGLANLTHCYGAVGVGRDVAPDTGTGGELYAVIGHAPRHLDRNIALVGRVIDGIDALSARQRGTEALGFIKDPKDHIPIVRARLVADMPAGERPSYEVLDTAGAPFRAYVHARANRKDSFFIRPAGGVDICNAPVPTRKRP
jgi:peptidylprolyl isomerase